MQLCQISCQLVGVLQYQYLLSMSVGGVGRHGVQFSTCNVADGHKCIDVTSIDK